MQFSETTRHLKNLKKIQNDLMTIRSTQERGAKIVAKIQNRVDQQPDILECIFQLSTLFEIQKEHYRSLNSQIQDILKFAGQNQVEQNRLAKELLGEIKRPPVSLATLRGILIKVAGELFIIPTHQVQQVIRVDRHKIKIVEHCPTFYIDGKKMILLDLAAVLNISSAGSASDANKTVAVVMIGFKEKVSAFKIDEVLGEEEILFKSLGKQLVKIPNISGATVLSSGKVVPILNAIDLCKTD